MLLQKAVGLVKQTGSLELPPGEYRLTTTVAMDGPYPPVSRTDIAHVFSNLTTPAAFFYGSGDLIITNPGADTGAGFITRFTFSETPGATSIIGSNPGADGTRLIMVTVPVGTDLTRLTPVVECAPGAHVSSPPPTVLLPDGSFGWTQGDYSRPTSWTAVGKNGVSQQYTVVINEGPDSNCLITNVAFLETALVSTPVIIHPFTGIVPGKITVVVPSTYTATNSLTPVFSIIGTEIKLVTAADTPATDTALSGSIDFTTNKIFRVYAASGVTRKYELTVLTAADPNAIITWFVFDEYPEYSATINSTPAVGTVDIELPYGAARTNLTPLVQYSGKILSPAYGVKQNFNVPVNYMVTAWDDSTTKEYKVTVTTKAANTNTGIFDFVITNVPKAKVIIGTKPRADGKIPIVVQVPYATSPLTTDGSNRTDLKKLIPKITLSSTLSTIYPDPNGTTDVIPFDNQNDYQEAVYRVQAQGGNTQDYVVVAARDVQYYYVSAAGDDTDPDLYNGGSESIPFKTLAHAVYQAVKHNVDHIFVIGTLNDVSEGGAWENTSTTITGNNGVFQTSGAPAVAGGASVFNLNGSGRNGGSAYPLYITGIGSNAVLQGTGAKRVISITGGADITFENITIQGGGNSTYGGNGGGMYIADNSRAAWKSGNITANTALSGGGVYVGSDSANDESEFEFMTGTISGNAATGNAATNFTTGNSPNMEGGGGVYVKGDALFWLANGQISGNSTRGSGGGVLVNGSAIPDNPTTAAMPHNFIMSTGAVNSNTSSGSVWPHGGGGIYVAKGVFEMLGGQVMNNSSVRQGGGVFVWSKALFWMDGNSSITANSGVGSAKALCSRGITTMRGNAQADKVYVWNYAKGSWNNGAGDEFTLMEGARVSGLVLAFADDPADNRNYINIVASDRAAYGVGQFFGSGTDPITTIDLESHLNTNGSFSTTATVEGDWLNQYLIKNGGNAIPAAQAAALLKRFPLGSFTSGKPSLSLSKYKLDTAGKLVAK
jgi:hypothetical protein